jgi:hypothetical protein
MAKTRVKFSKDTEGGSKMAVQAKGNAPATGMARTPAPDVISKPRGGTVAGYGMGGGANNPSSVEPGKAVRSLLGQNLLDSVDDDGVLDHIIQKGTARQDDSITGQLRNIAAGNVPVHPAMASAPKAAFPGGNSSASAPKAAAPKASAANKQFNDTMARANKAGAKATPGELAASTKLS